MPGPLSRTCSEDGVSGHGHRRPGRGNGDRVREQVVEHLAQPVRADENGAAHVRREPDALLGRNGLPRVEPVGDGLGEVHALCRGRLGAGKREQTVDETREPLRFGQRTSLVTVLQTKAQRRQRCAQLVRGVGDELLLRVEEKLEPAHHVVEGACERAHLWWPGALRGSRREVTVPGAIGGLFDGAQRVRDRPRQ